MYYRWIQNCNPLRLCEYLAYSKGENREIPVLKTCMTYAQNVLIRLSLSIQYVFHMLIVIDSKMYSVFHHI